MSFYQNQNTSTTTLSPTFSFSVGFDALSSSAIPGWSAFMTDPEHSGRRLAFQEFIYLMFYHQHREVDGAKFPHNILFEKVLKYFYINEIETKTISYLGTSITVNKYIPMSDTPVSLRLFSITTDSNYAFAKKNTSASGLPKLRNASDEAAITAAIKADMMAGNTSLGFFQEAATLFSFFYLTRQLVILTGHNWDCTTSLLPENNVITKNRSISYLDANDVYGTTPVSDRTARITLSIAGMNPAIDLPYFYNSLIDLLISFGFQVPKTVFSSTATPSAEDQIFMANFLKLLDPVRCMGIPHKEYLIDPPPLPSASPTYYVEPTLFSKYDIGPTTATSPQSIGVTFNTSAHLNQNNFLEDLFIIMRSGNSGFDGIDPSVSPPRRFYIRKTGTFTNIGTSSSTINASDREVFSELLNFYSEYTELIKQAINNETKYMLSALYPGLKTSPTNKLLGSGAGEVSVALLGIKNLGVPFFNYSVLGYDNKRTVQVQHKQDVRVEKLSFEKRQVVHFGGFGLDLDGPGSNLTINVSLFGDFKFVLIPESGSGIPIYILGDTKVEIKQLPKSSNINFYTVKIAPAGGPVSYQFYKKMTIDNKTTPHLTSDVLVAEYFEEKRDLVFEKFTKAQRETYNFTSDTYELKCTIQSAFAPDPSFIGRRSYEELTTFVSVYEEEAVLPRLITEDVRFANDTFELHGITASKLKANPKLDPNVKSREAIFKDTSDEDSIKIILETLKEDYYRATKWVTLHPPTLLGGYVGKQYVPTGTTSTSANPKIVSDNNYKPKFNSPSPINEGVGDPRLYPLLRYSKANLEINTTVTSIFPLAANYNIYLTIKSNVSPDVSDLLSRFTSSETSLKDLIKGKINFGDPDAGSLNQVLAMLRSFGLLEALVMKIKSLIPSGYTNDEKEYIEGVLETWLPPEDIANTTKTDAIICKDEILTYGVIYATDITLTEYYKLKRYK